MAKVDDLVDRLLLLVPTVGPAQAAMSITEAMRKFMRETSIYTDRVKIHPDGVLQEFLVDIPDDRLLTSIRGVEVDGSYVSDWARDGQYNVIRFGSVPDKGLCIFVDYDWAIKTTHCEVPDSLVYDYGMDIVAGARAILHSAMGTAFYDPNLASENRVLFDMAINNVKADAVIGFANSRPKMHLPHRHSTSVNKSWGDKF